nr:hypothetical protein [Alicyclobacillus mali (ex Roth et al. 2021)]
MASLNSFVILEWIHKMQVEDHIDVLRELIQLIAQFMVDAEVAEKTGAERAVPFRCARHRW